MNQLFTLSSQQLPFNPTKPQPKHIPLLSQEHPNRTDKKLNIFKSKKRMKRIEQVLDMASKRMDIEQMQTKQEPKGRLKSFIVSQLNRINLNIAPMTIKIQQRPQTNAPKQRCVTESNEEESLLFTFYPKQKLSQGQTNDTSISQEIINNSKRVQARSYSLKNSPIVDYPQSNKILPKVFRVRTEGECIHFRKTSDLPNNEENEAKKAQQIVEETYIPLKECNRQRKRVFSIRSRSKLDCRSMEKIHSKPILKVMTSKQLQTEEQILL